MKNITFDEINVGDKATYTRTITQKDIEDFAAVSGDNNPVHLSEEFAKNSQFGGVIAHGMLAVSFISKILGTEYPGPGTIFMGMNNLKFLAPVRPGDTVEAMVEVTKKHDSKPVVTFECSAVNQDGVKLLEAEAVVLASTSRIEFTPKV